MKRIPTLRHTGYNGICAVIRKRKGQKRWIRIEYQRLSLFSGQRWLCLQKRGLVNLIRDAELEIISGLVAAKNKKQAAP